jgi:transcriptional regulator with GAF, ATPase, and Fis domain
VAASWMTWPQTPWMGRDFPHVGVLQFGDRATEFVTRADSPAAYLERALPQTAAELGGEWAALARRDPRWEYVASSSEAADGTPPARELSECLDREAAGFVLGQPPLLLVPLPDLPGQVLVVGGRKLDAGDLPLAWALGRILSRSLQLLASRSQQAERVQRLRQTLHLAQRFARETETLPLLEMIADEATRLLNCDRASIFLWDREHRQLVACPALGVEDRTLRLPDNKGIVGEVVQSGVTIRVDDAYADPRFDQGVDRRSGYKTRNLLCVPLIDGDGQRVGAFELINKNDGDFTTADEEALADLGVQVAIAVQNVQQREHLLRSNRQLTEAAVERIRIVGESPSIGALRASIDRLAATDLPVLILGESGTGKEVCAQSVHYKGPRADQPFVAVNCAALTETLLESELFGHEKGAFTDAHDTRPGKFELADGGTLFLDEIGDMSPGGQAKLLRVLEQKVITRVGGSQVIPINVRIVAATNANLTEKVRQKKFREDLYYRLSVVTLDIPPLRDRPEDVQALSDFFLAQFCRQANRKPMTISAEARRRLQAHAWPGNVRELRNLMERIAFLAQGDTVQEDDLAFILSPETDPLESLSPDTGLSEATNLFQQEFIRKAIRRVRGNMSEAARLLGLHRSNLYRKMRQLGMETDGEIE